MIARLQKSMNEKDKGFTLVELLVVIVIIGILAGIAIPLFLSQRKKGVDAGVKSDLKALATIEETHYVDAQAYTTDKTLLQGQGWTASKGNVIEAATSGQLYCLRGSNPAGNKAGATGGYYYYAPDAGGLSEAAEGACTAVTAWTPVH